MARLVALALVLGCCAVVGATQPASARPAVTEFRGSFVCGRDGRPLAGARVEIWTQWKTGLPKLWPNAKQIGATRADANGGWSWC